VPVELRHHRVVANRIKQHYVQAGSGPPVVLLHGFPFTWYAWRHQIPVLGERYRLIVPDLRGYGATEKALHGYDKRTMAHGVRTTPIAFNGHMPREEQPEAVNEALLEFLAPCEG
jgi:haloacetate dehalogenase